MSLQLCPTVSDQAPTSMGFSRQEYWSELPFPPPEDLPDSGIELVSLLSPALASEFFTTRPPGKPRHFIESSQKPIGYLPPLTDEETEVLESLINIPVIMWPVSWLVSKKPWVQLLYHPASKSTGGHCVTSRGEAASRAQEYRDSGCSEVPVDDFLV